MYIQGKTTLHMYLDIHRSVSRYIIDSYTSAENLHGTETDSYSLHSPGGGRLWRDGRHVLLGEIHMLMVQKSRPGMY